METGDTWDKPAGKDQKILWAFNPLSSDLAYHGPTRGSGILNQISDCMIFLFSAHQQKNLDNAVKLKLPHDYSTGIYVVVYLGTTIGVVLAVFLIGVLTKYSEHFTHLTVTFCYVRFDLVEVNS